MSTHKPSSRDPPAPFHPTATRRAQNVVRVGVAVLLVEAAEGLDKKVWVGIRKGSHGAGTLALPGGHLEMFESWEECAHREVLEEMNLRICNVRFLHVTNDPMPDENKHYITIFMTADTLQDNDNDGVPTNMEPDKCEGWKAMEWTELQQQAQTNPDSLFGPLLKLVQDNPASVQSLFH